MFVFPCDTIFLALRLSSRGKIVLGYTEAELRVRGSGYQFIHAADMLYCAENHVRSEWYPNDLCGCSVKSVCSVWHSMIKTPRAKIRSLFPNACTQTSTTIKMILAEVSTIKGIETWSCFAPERSS